MDGDSGFCSTILGTPDFAEGASAIKQLLGQSLCHTLDRGDYRALREECCLANEADWEKAAEWNFKINNWPYVNAESETVKECFYKMDKMSPENLAKDNAMAPIYASFSILAIIFTTATAF